MNYSCKISREVLAMAAALMMAGCVSEQERRLDTMVEEHNAACPIEIDDGIAVEKVSRSGQMLIYDVKVDIPVEPLARNAEAARRVVAEAIAGSEEPDVRAELEICRDAGASMKYVLTDALGDTFSIVINPSDYIK